MKKLFTLIALLVSVFAVFAVSNINSKVDAASGVATLKLSSSYWGQASAYYSIHYWGGETSSSWPGAKFNDGKSANGNVEITANYDPTSTHVIIIRWGNSGYSTEWNRWNYFDTNEMTTKYNYFTNTAWDSCSSKWVEPAVEYTVTHHDKDGAVHSTNTVVENSEYIPEFIEVEGYALEGWYKDTNLTNKITKGEKITSNLNLYPKYVEATDYTIYFDNALGWTTVNAYMYCDAYDGHYNVGWPGAEMQKDENGALYITVDASQSFDKIIFNNGKDQTTNLALSGVQSGDTYAIGEKNSEDKYTATLQKTSVVKNLNALIASYHNEGIYTKATTIYLSETAVNELVVKNPKKFFHADASELVRMTYFNGDALWMSRADGKYSYYGTSGTNMTNAVVNAVGDTSEKVVVTGQTMEDYYYTILDVVATGAQAWTYADGVYTTTNTGVYEWFKAITAPCYLGFDAETVNYITFTSATIEEVDGTLVLSLYATGDSGKLTSEGGLFSQAIITTWDGVTVE